MPSFTVKEVDGVGATGLIAVRKVMRGQRCPFDDFRDEARSSGMQRDYDVCLLLLGDLGAGKEVPAAKFKWLRDHPQSGAREHDGEFELKVKRLRCYGILDGVTVYLMFGGHIKKSRGGKGKKSESNQNQEIKRFRTLVREWIQSR